MRDSVAEPQSQKVQPYGQPRLVSMIARRLRPAPKGVEQPGEERRRDDVEVGDAVAVAGADDRLAVAEA